jgi:phosphate/sulfate permease
VSFLTLLSSVPWWLYAAFIGGIAAAWIYKRWRNSIREEAMKDQHIKNLEADRKVQDAITKAGEDAPTSRNDVVDRLRKHDF